MSSRTFATTTARSKASRAGRRKKSPLPKKLVESDESDSTDVITSSDEEDRWKDKKRATDDLPPDYWSIQKLVKYVKAGNTTATMVSLCCLKDYDLTTQLNQLVSPLSRCVNKNPCHCYFIPFHCIRIPYSVIPFRSTEIIYIIICLVLPCLVRAARKSRNSCTY